MANHAALRSVPQVDIDIIYHETDGLITKEMRIPAGFAVGKEIHDYSHQSFLVEGIVKLHRGDEIEVLTAPTVINIAARIEHSVEAMTNVIWYCVHNSDRAEHA